MQGDIVMKNFTDIINSKETVGMLPIITIYFDTKDYPNKYVARVFNPIHKENGNTIPKPLPYVTVAESIEAITDTIPKGMHFLIRNPEDEETIIGSWI